MFSDGYMKRTNRPLLRLLNPLRGLRLPQCRWIGNYYFMTHQSWIWVHKDFQQDEGELSALSSNILKTLSFSQIFLSDLVYLNGLLCQICVKKF